MALATTTVSGGVGTMAATPTVSAAPAAPVLFDDIDPILLVRLYPTATSADDMRSQAMAAGQATAAAGADLVASQNEPVLIEGDGSTPASTVSGSGGTSSVSGASSTSGSTSTVSGSSTTSGSTKSS